MRTISIAAAKPNYNIVPHSFSWWPCFEINPKIALKTLRLCQFSHELPNNLTWDRYINCLLEYQCVCKNEQNTDCIDVTTNCIYIGFKTVLNGFCCAGTSSCETFIHAQKKNGAAKTMTFSPGQITWLAVLIYYFLPKKIRRTKGRAAGHRTIWLDSLARRSCWPLVGHILYGWVTPAIQMALSKHFCRRPHVCQHLLNWILDVPVKQLRGTLFQTAQSKTWEICSCVSRQCIWPQPLFASNLFFLRPSESVTTVLSRQGTNLQTTTKMFLGKLYKMFFQKK